MRLLSSVLCLPALSGCALFTLAATQRSHPQLDGAMALAAAPEEVRILRDEHGIPHIRAATESGGWYGLGVVHAQDRLFQADLSRHVAHGRISEWLGASAVDLDVFVRSMELQSLGEGIVANAEPETVAMIEAYTRGLNDGAESLKTLPVEYRLLDVPFEPWTPADTTAILFLQAYGLQENLDHELTAWLLRRHDAATLDALLKSYRHTPAIDPFFDTLRTKDLGVLTEPFKAFTGALGGRPEANSQASNNWVVGPERTASGKPILANDPHLTQRVPSLWYAADVQGGQIHVAGATLAGTPGVPVGHNERVAWGVTNVMADMIDLVMLERDGEGVIIAGETRPLTARIVSVSPRDAEPVTATVMWTELGPVVSEGPDGVMVMRWLALEMEDHTPDFIRAMATSESAAMLKDAASSLPSMVPQNLAIADVEGDYGWLVAGSIPRRQGFTGRVPYPGSDPAFAWDGIIEDRPGAFQPDAGFVVTANSKPEHPSADRIATAFLPPHRYDRITERLRDLPAATPADMSALHLDVQDGSAMRHLPWLLDEVATDGMGTPCLKALSSWDRVASVDSVGATVWAVFQDEVVKVALEPTFEPDELSLIMDLASTARSPLDGDFHVFLQDRPKQVGEALSRTCARLIAAHGPMEQWDWGSVHTLALKHPFSAKSKLLSGWSMPEVPYPGTGATVSPADYDAREDRWTTGFMASMRIVMPLDDLGASTFVHPGGQAGQPKSPYYASHFEAFVAGQTLPLYFDVDDVAAHARHTLVISADAATPRR